MLEVVRCFYKLALNVRQRFLALSDQNAISQVDQVPFLRLRERKPQHLAKSDKRGRWVYNPGEHGVTSCWNR